MSRLATLLFAALSLVPALASANVLFKADFETGDISQWDDREMVSADRLTAVPSPVREGKYALRALVKQGDDPINASGNRNELLQYTYEPEGSEYWYSWSTMFDASFPAPATWQVFVQWHHTGNSGSPPVEFSIENNEIQLGTNTNGETIVWRTPLVRSVWHDFVFHVKWSPNSSVGFVELWYDGQLVVPKRNLATSYAGMTTYLKMGLYRNDTISPDGIVYHDNFIMGTTQADVTPAYAGGGTTTTPPTDGGTTTSGGTTSGGTTSGGTTTGGTTDGGSTSGGTTPAPTTSGTTTTSGGGKIPTSPTSSSNTPTTPVSGCGGQDGIGGMLTALLAAAAKLLGRK